MNMLGSKTSAGCLLIAFAVLLASSILCVAAIRLSKKALMKTISNVQLQPAARLCVFATLVFARLVITCDSYRSAKCMSNQNTVRQFSVVVNASIASVAPVQTISAAPMAPLVKLINDIVYVRGVQYPVSSLRKAEMAEAKEQQQPQIVQLSLKFHRKQEVILVSDIESANHLVKDMSMLNAAPQPPLPRSQFVKFSLSSVLYSFHEIADEPLATALSIIQSHKQLGRMVMDKRVYTRRHGSFDLDALLARQQGGKVSIPPLPWKLVIADYSRQGLQERFAEFSAHKAQQSAHEKSMAQTFKPHATPRMSTTCR